MKFRFIILSIIFCSFLCLKFDYIRTNNDPLTFKAEIEVDNQGYLLDTTKSETTILDKNNFDNGIIGLLKTDKKQNFLNYLVDKSLISKKVFYQNINENEAYIAFGEDPNLPMTYCKTLNDKWECEITELKINNGENIKIQKNAVFDLSTNIIVFPETLRNTFEKYLINDSCYFNYWMKIYSCKNPQTLKDLTLNINNVEYKIPFKNLFYKSSNSENLLLIKFSGEEIILGQIFLQNYLVLFNAETSQIGFGKGNRTLKPIIQEKLAVQMGEIGNETQEFEIFHFLIICGVILFIVILGFIFYLTHKSKMDYYDKKYGTNKSFRNFNQKITSQI